jgi:hypothetical protein
MGDFAAEKQKTPTSWAGVFRFATAPILAAVIHVKLNRMRCHTITVLLLLLEFKVALDEILRKHATLGENFVVGPKTIDHYLQQSA